MFIDFVTLLLLNMAAGLLILSHFVYLGLDAADQKAWAPGFAISGLVGLLGGIHMVWTWPLPGPYNSAWGEMSVLLSALFLGAALACAKGWPLHSLAVYAFLAGLGAVVLGVRIIHLRLSSAPLLTGIGFLLTGGAGVLACPALALRSNRRVRLVGALVLVAAAAIWAFIGLGGIWMHMEVFAKWHPATMR